MSELQFWVWLGVQISTVISVLFGGGFYLFKMGRWVGTMTQEVKALARDVSEAKGDSDKAHERIDKCIMQGA